MLFKFPSLSERGSFLTFTIIGIRTNRLLKVSISFRERFLPDDFAVGDVLTDFVPEFPSLSERGSFLTKKQKGKGVGV